MEWKGGTVNHVNHTSWVAVVTPTDRPKSVRNHCLIELFVPLFVLSLCPFDISVGVGAFVIGLGLISSFLSLRNLLKDVSCFKIHIYRIISFSQYQLRFVKCQRPATSSCEVGVNASSVSFIINKPTFHVKLHNLNKYLS